MPWRGPTEQRPFPTLGWAVLNWTYKYLPSPSDDHAPLRYTDEQARRILRWYEIDPATGEFVYLRLILEDAKGWGKSPMAASLMLAELAGPVCFDGWDATGEPIAGRWGENGRPPPWVQVAATAEDQAENTYGALYAMLTANDGRAAKELGIDFGRTRLYLRGRSGKLEPVTARAGTREGDRITAAVLDETWLWVPRSGGVKLALTLQRNLAKMGGRSVETTNAPILGENSVAEQSDPSAPDPGTLHYAPQPTIEPDPSWPDEKLREALLQVYSDVPWADPERRIREMRNPGASWDDVLRFWFNIRTAGARRAVDPRVWDALARPGAIPPAGTVIGLGFDGSISRDATALIACTRDGFSWPLRIWERPHDAPEDWRIPRLEVKAAIADAFTRYRVGLMLADPPRWATEIEEWAEKYALGPKPEQQRVLAFDTNQPRRMAPAVDRWLTAIREGAHTHAGDEALTRHVKAAHLQKVRMAADESDGRSMYILAKGDDRAWIDAAVADVLAYQAAMTLIEPVVKRKGGWAFAG